MNMLRELQELEQTITPDMNVYKNVISTGFDHILFKPGFLSNLLILEELLYMVTHGIELNRLTEDQTKGRPPVMSDILKTKLIKIDKTGTTEVGHSEHKDEDESHPRTKIIIKKLAFEPSSKEDSGEEAAGIEGSSSQRASITKQDYVRIVEKREFRRVSERKSAAKSLVYTNRTNNPQDLLGSFVGAANPSLRATSRSS